MRNPSSLLRRVLPLGMAALVAVIGVTAVAMAAGGATSSKAGKVKVEVPGPGARRAEEGDLPPLRQAARRAPRPTGTERAERLQRATKARRATRETKAPPVPPGLRYEVVNQTFKEVFIENSGSPRGLSEVKTVSCPAGKRAIGGGTDLGTNAAQNGQQRQVTVSLNGPNGTGTGWSVQLFFYDSTTIDTSIDLRVYAICANV